jgi:septum formation protein
MQEKHSLILASSSVYRKELLSRLQIPFNCQTPNIDETQRVNETIDSLIERLSTEKATAIASQNPDAWVIGSDQVADLDGQAIGKPGTFEKALAQLEMMQGKTVVFKTGVCFMHFASKRSMYACIPTQVTFHTLDKQILENYLHAEKPYDCAGSAKSEGLGIMLLSKVESQDPTALIGLPLITIANFLRLAHFQIAAPLIS